MDSVPRLAGKRVGGPGASRAPLMGAQPGSEPGLPTLVQPDAAGGRQAVGGGAEASTLGHNWSRPGTVLQLGGTSQ